MRIITIIKNKIKLRRQKKRILKLQNTVWSLKKNNVVVGYYKNPSHVAKYNKELKRSTLYYYISKYGTYRSKIYELTCQKY